MSKINGEKINYLQRESRVLLFSSRNIYEPEAFRGPLNEFENIIKQIDSVDILAPEPRKWFKQRKNNAMRVAKFQNIIINPGIQKTKLKKNYDLFLAVCQFPSELLYLSAIKGLKDHCKTMICILDEIWKKEIPIYRNYFKTIENYDYLILFTSQSVEKVEKHINGRCLYLSPGVDTTLFCPYPNPPERVIDVLSLGRKAKHTHEKLLQMAKENRMFYIYDSLSDLHTSNLEQHRFLIANLAKRSKYFLVNPGRIDKPKETGNQSEIGARYFEGAASGTVLIGETPDNEMFDKEFTWEDAGIYLPYDSINIANIIGEIGGQPDRINRIRKNNIIQSLVKHDWVYRWEKILSISGLEASPGLENRKFRLKQLAGQIENEENR